MNSARLLGSQTATHHPFVPSDGSVPETPTPFFDCCAALIRCRMEDSGTEASSSPIAPCTQMRCRGQLRFLSARLPQRDRSEEHTSELQSLRHLVCRLLLE